jgi:hypothetical protein
VTVETPALSIVIASVNPGPVIFECLNAIDRQNGRDCVQLLVVDGSADDTAERVRARFPRAQVIRVDGITSLPKLRGVGIASATAPVVGILDPWCVMSDGWVTATIHAHTSRREPVIGAGVDLEPLERRSLTAWATYLYDYWEFVAPFESGKTRVLPGNNITYKRDALPPATTLRSAGFWKAFLNAELRRAGHSLWSEPALTVRMRRRVPLAQFFRSRFHHGRSYAAMRVRGAPLLTRWKWALVAPALPLLLLARQVRGIARKPVARLWFLACLPLLLAFHVSWAWGELCGYLVGAGRSDDAIRI